MLNTLFNPLNIPDILVTILSGYFLGWMTGRFGRWVSLLVIVLIAAYMLIEASIN